MSRLFRDKNKDLVNLSVVSSEKVWTKSKTGKPRLRKDIEIFGRVDKTSSCFVSSTNLLGNNHKFVEDTNKLPKKIKNSIIDLLKNKNKKVAYLIKDKR